MTPVPSGLRYLSGYLRAYLWACLSVYLCPRCRFQHHIPFRESKLTHFLQFFFCGAGRVSMVVNINQNSSCFDETLNVLKFSALAQKVSERVRLPVFTVRPAGNVWLKTPDTFSPGRRWWC